MKKIFYFLFSAALLFSAKINAQVISEGFEESGWSVTGVAASTTVTVTETYGTAGTWAYKSNSVVTAAAAPAAQAHTGTRGLAYTSSSSSYLITPLITSGVSQVTVWVYPNGTSAAVVIGAGTNTTVTANTGSISSTGGGAWSLASSVYNTGNGLTTGQWNQITFNIPASVTSNFTNPAYVKIQRTANNFQIDDIVITSPATITPPTVTTDNPVATSITDVSAVLGGAITDAGAGTITSSGFCYGLTADPTTAGTKTTDGPTAVGTITSTITGLTFSTTYHVRAYATGSAGTVYGADVTFTTAAPSTPTLSVLPTSLNFGSQLLTTTSAEKTFAITAAGLSPASDNITVTAPAGYEVSSTTGTGFASSINIAYTGGALTGTVYVHFTPATLSAYNGNITVSGGGATTQNVAVTGSGTDVVYTTGDYKAIANGNWGTNTTWAKWDGSAWVPCASGDFPNLKTANVYIDVNDTVTAETSARSCNNLYLLPGSMLKSNNKVNTPLYVKIHGTTLSVAPTATYGSPSANLGDAADGISIDYYGLVSNPTLTITGGGTINVSRLRTDSAGTTVIIDNDMSVNYHGTKNFGNAAGFYTQAGDNNVFTINAGKTFTFAPWSCYTPVSSSHTNSTLSQTFNINGTLTFMPGNPVPDTVAVANWGWHPSNYLSFGMAAGKTGIINIGATGILNATEFYPNGTKADNTPGTGDLVTINVAAGGVLNVSKIADFRKATQTVSGAGAFNLLSAAKLRIGSTDGITAASALGPVQTATRSYSAGAAYAYEGTAAQVSGDGLPANVGALIINNATGLTLSSSVQTNDSLSLTNGVITSSSSNMLTVGSASATKGGSTASHVAGPLTKLTAGTAAYAFPIGKGGVYRPASVTPADASASSFTGEYFAISGASATSVSTPITSVGTNEYWDISRNSGTNAQVSLNYDNTKTTTWSNAGTPDASQDITVAHLVGGNWVDEGGTTGTTILGDVASGTIVSQELNSFSPFTFGLKPHGTVPLNMLSFNATKVAGQTKLIWTTSNELNISLYVVEKSTDGRNYVSAGVVNATNLNNNNYSFTDAAASAGVTYYRLKITDKAGNFKYSSIIAVNSKKLSALNIFPNPVKDNLYVSHAKATNGAKLEIYGMDGRKINDLKVNADAVQTTINTSSLSKGSYNLVFVNGEDVQYIRFIKQ